MEHLNSSSNMQNIVRLSPYDYADMEIESVLSFWEQVASNVKVTVHLSRLQDVIEELCYSSLSKRRVILLYFHNASQQFSKTFCGSLNTSKVIEMIERRFFLLGWDISDEKFHGALKDALNKTVVLSDLVPIVTKKEPAAFFIVPVENTITLCTVLKGSKISVQDIIRTLETTEKFAQKEILEERELAQLTEQQGSENDFDSIKYQMLMADMLGDRDYDSFDFDELKYLRDKIGFALYGPPEKENGYSDKQNKTIDEIYDVIRTASDEIAEYKDTVEISFVTNCTEPLPREKLSRAKKYKEDYNPKTDINPVPVFILRKCRCSDDPCRVFIDHTGRVYNSWVNYLTNNKLPECEMILPKNGRYEVNNMGEVLLEKHLSPACGIETKLLLAADIGSTAGGLISGGIFLAAAIPSIAVAPAALVAGTFVGVGVGIYAIARSGYALYDRTKHKESMSFANAEARGAYLNIVAGSLGFVGAGANMAVAQLATRGFNIGQGAAAAVNTINVVNLGAGGAAMLNSGYEVVYKWVNDNERPSVLTIIQLSSSVLFFGHAVYNFKTCSTIVQESQAQVLQEYQNSLRSNRHRKTFTKLLKETISRNDGVEVRGRAEVIKTIHQIPNKDDVFAVLTRTNKAMNEKGIKYSAEGGKIKLNGIAVDMDTFVNMNKKEANSFLKNLSDLSVSSNGEPTSFTQSTSFYQDVKAYFNDLSVEDAIKISSTCSQLMKVCTEDVKTKIINAASKLICNVGKNCIDWLDKCYSKYDKWMKVIQVVTSYFSNKADEMEIQYNKWKKTGNNEDYNIIFSFVDMNHANRFLKFFERCVLNSYSGRHLVQNVLTELCEYFTTWFTEVYYEEQIKNNRTEERKKHSAGRRTKKNSCQHCGGYYFSSVK